MMFFIRSHERVRQKSILVYSSFILLSLMFSSQVTHAAFTDSITIGNPKALSLGHAITADPPDIDSIHFNPAGLVDLKDGRQMYLKAIAGIFTTEMQLGEYGEYTLRQQERYRQQYEQYDPDGDGVLTYGRSPWEEYVYDEALNSKSEAEGGPTIMLPGGMVDLPIGAGASGGASYRPPGSRFTFGTNVYAPLMNGFHRGDDDPGRFAQQRVAFTLITFFSPTVAFEVTDTLSMGVSVNFNYSGMGMQLPIREPHEAIYFLGSPFIQGNFCNEDGTPKDYGITAIDVCTTEVPPYSQYAELNFEVDTNVVVGYNLGLLWRPQPWLSLGLAYNSSLNVQMDGNYFWPIQDPFKTFLVNFQSSSGWDEIVTALGYLDLQLPTAEQIAEQGNGSLSVSYEMPQRWNAGISVQVTPNLKVNADIRWTEWSAFSAIDLDFGNDVPLLMWGGLADMIGTGGQNGISPNKVAYQLSLQDVTYWGMGMEYRWSDRLVLRAGYEDRPSAVPEEAPNAFIPMNDAKLLSVGFGLELEGDSHLDFAIGYLNSETHFPPCTASLGNSCDPANVVYPVYAGQDIKTKLEVILFELGYQKPF